MKNLYLTAFLTVVLILSSCGKKSSYQYTKSVKKPDTTLDVIVESNRLAAIYDYLTPADYHRDTLVILDLDNTLVHPPTDLGSDQWFYEMCKKFEAQGMSHIESINHFLPSLFHLMNHLWMVPTEAKTVKLVNSLHKKGITVLGLTARSIEMHHRTLEQLERLGIQFSYFTPHEFVIEECEGKEGLFADGIIFSGNCDKGELLSKWLEMVGYHPRKVIFVDDKLKNVHSVEQALHKRNYPFIGIRYGYLDDHIRAFDLDATQEEYKQFLLKYPPPKHILLSMYA